MYKNKIFYTHFSVFIVNHLITGKMFIFVYIVVSMCASQYFIILHNAIKRSRQVARVGVYKQRCVVIFFIFEITIENHFEHNPKKSINSTHFQWKNVKTNMNKNSLRSIKTIFFFRVKKKIENK